jgi:Ni,Fe-hydrogenase III small subunit/Pyruvate/2-oxoacid:ferredoxin oxidoreductase delta subunit
VLEILLERLRQGTRTGDFPQKFPELPARFRGRPFIDEAKCLASAGEKCDLCAMACPLRAIDNNAGGEPALDMGQCSFCGQCARICPRQAIIFTTDWRLSTTKRAALVVRPERYSEPARPDVCSGVADGLLRAPDRRRYFLPALPITPVTELDSSLAKSLRLRQVTAAGCGACEADLNVLTTLVFDMARFGLDFVASPRHADAIALTGPVPPNMRRALEDCRAAMPLPYFVIAVGTCAISGGLFRSPAISRTHAADAVQGALPHTAVSLFIAGCPPHPYTTLDALLRFLDQKTATSS